VLSPIGATAPLIVKVAAPSDNGVLLGISAEALVLFATLLVLIWQTAATRREMRQAAVRNIYDRYMEIGKMEISHPELHMMFMEPEALETATTKLSADDLRTRALALLILDQFALIFNLGDKPRLLYQMGSALEKLPEQSRVRRWWRGYADRHRTVFDINKDYIASVVTNPMVRRAWSDLGLGVTWKGSMFYEFVERCLSDSDATRRAEVSGEQLANPQAPTESSGAEMARVKHVYDGCAAEYTATFCNPETIAVDVPYLVQLCRDLPQGAVVLDVGCGPGMHANFFASRGYTYLGCDLSSEMIRQARRQHPDATFCHADVLDLPFGTETVDACLALESLIHFDRYTFGRSVREIGRCLGRGAPLLLGLQLAAFDGEEVLTVPYPLGCNEQVPVRFVSEAVVTADLESVGFEVMWTRRREALTGELHSDKLHVLCRRRGDSGTDANGVWAGSSLEQELGS
jgi:SAM-dependent methyltransferase